MGKDIRKANFCCVCIRLCFQLLGLLGCRDSIPQHPESAAVGPSVCCQGAVVYVGAPGNVRPEPPAIGDKTNGCVFTVCTPTRTGRTGGEELGTIRQRGGGGGSAHARSARGGGGSASSVRVSEASERWSSLWCSVVLHLARVQSAVFVGVTGCSL